MEILVLFSLFSFIRLKKKLRKLPNDSLCTHKNARGIIRQFINYNYNLLLFCSFMILEDFSISYSYCSDSYLSIPSYNKIRSKQSKTVVNFVQYKNYN